MKHGNFILIENTLWEYTEFISEKSNGGNMKILHYWLSLGTYIMPDFSYHTLNSFWQLILGSIINEKLF